MVLVEREMWGKWVVNEIISASNPAALLGHTARVYA